MWLGLDGLQERAGGGGQMGADSPRVVANPVEPTHGVEDLEDFVGRGASAAALALITTLFENSARAASLAARRFVQ
jgi:hypothetical protein